MKKLFVSCMIAFMAICSVGAQEVYIGGGFTVGSEDSEFVFQISPEVGCHLTDQWAVGGEIGYTHYDDYNRFQFAPYARYTFYKTGIVGLFVDGTIGIASEKYPQLTIRVSGVTVIPVSGWDCVRDFL